MLDSLLSLVRKDSLTTGILNTTPMGILLKYQLLERAVFTN